MASETLPFAARSLTRRELQREDTYIFRSPKQDETITLLGVTRLAFWLEREFDPLTVACVARPRSLEWRPGHEIELDFWVRLRDGTETFWVTVGADDTRATNDGYQAKDSRAWDDAARRAGLSLDYAYEQALSSRAQRLANYLRLLPHVQAARRRPQVPLLMSRIQEAFHVGVLSLSFLQLERTLETFPAHEVRMAACVLIHAGWLDFPRDTPLSRHTSLKRRT